MKGWGSKMKMICNDCKRPYEEHVVHEDYCPNCGSYDVKENPKQ
jgi:Zn finger protein HypA/HybF involved in hydrogenase expression